MRTLRSGRNVERKKVESMKPLRVRWRCPVRDFLAVLCSVLLVSGDPAAYAQPLTQDAAPQEQAEPKIPNDQLDSLVAPIALYPDPLLAQEEWAVSQSRRVARLAVATQTVVSAAP